MGYINGDSDLATYTFEEAIELIRITEDDDEMSIIAGVIDEERRYYSIYHLKLLRNAFELRRDCLRRDLQQSFFRKKSLK